MDWNTDVKLCSPSLTRPPAPRRAVRANAEYVPPYGSGGSMYIRPFLVGSGPILGLQPCNEFQLMVSVTPVGNYFGKGGLKGIHANVMQNFDRAAPHG